MDPWFRTQQVDFGGFLIAGLFLIRMKSSAAASLQLPALVHSRVSGLSLGESRLRLLPTTYSATATFNSPTPMRNLEAKIQTIRHSLEPRTPKMWQPKKNASERDFVGSNISSVASSRRTSPHRPNTNQDEEHVYVLTLSLSPSISVPLDQMREEYFPKQLNHTPAHITLFHALPHSQIEVIDAHLKTTAARTRPYNISTGSPFRLRRGVAVMLGSGDEQSQHLREEFRETWETWLSKQDRSGWHPHWTVMNKVDDEKKVESAFNTIRRILFEDVQHGKVVGFDLWKYNGGDWEPARQYRFQDIGRKTPAKKDSVGSDGYFEQKSDGSRTPKSPSLKKAGSMMAEVWRTVTLGKNSPKQSPER